MALIMREPSKGGMGIRLKTARTMFIITPKIKICPNRVLESAGKLLRKDARIKAVIKLEQGPATPT